MWAAVGVLLGSAASAAAALLVPVVPPVPVPHEPQLRARARRPRQPELLAPAQQLAVVPVVLLVQAPPEPLLLNPLPSPLPRVVVESEVPVRLQGLRSFSAAMARSSPPTGKPTYWRVASTR